MPDPAVQYPNISVPFWDDGDEITCTASAAVLGSRFVKVSGNTVDGTPRIAPCALGDATFGVAVNDADPAGVTAAPQVMVFHATSKVVSVKAGAALTAWQPVMSGAAGVAVPWDGNPAHVVLGRALFDCANGAQAAIDRQVNEIAGAPVFNDLADAVYDPTDSGLDAEDGQAAIDELAARDAADVPYTNAGLDPAVEEVKAALDEIVTRLIAVEP